MTALIALLLAPQPLATALEVGATTGVVKAGAMPLATSETLLRAYRSLGPEPIWTTDRRRRLLRAIEASHADGLRPADYHLARLRRAKGVERELLASDAFLSLAAQLLDGKVDPKTHRPNWSAEGRELDLAGTLLRIREGEDPTHLLDKLRSPHPEYAALKRRLPKAKAAEARGIRANLERLRWLPRDLGERHVFVNIPEFEVALVEGGELRGLHRAVIGRPDRPTPPLSSVITYLVVDPYWRIPPRVSAADVMPGLYTEPAPRDAQGLEVLQGHGRTLRRRRPSQIDWRQPPRGYRLRMRPGPTNPLGRIKFMFANDRYLSLHDTIEPQHFGLEVRTYSSGCVRVERPFELARWLLHDTPWSQPHRFAEALDAHPRKPQRVELRSPTPVHLSYLTLRADGRALRKVPDVYERDLALSHALRVARR